MYKLKTKDGKVNSLLKTGKDFVKNTLPEKTAKKIIDAGKIVDSDQEGYPICIDGKWYFEGTVSKSEETPVKVNDTKGVGKTTSKTVTKNE